MYCHKDLKSYRDEVTNKITGCWSEYVNVALCVENMDGWFHSCKNKHLICVRSLSSGVWCCAFHKKFTNILDEPSPTIFTFFYPADQGGICIWSFGKFTPHCTVSQSKLQGFFKFLFFFIFHFLSNHLEYLKSHFSVLYQKLYFSINFIMKPSFNLEIYSRYIREFKKCVVKLFTPLEE